MNNNEYISIAEFAERANISKQAVYQQLDKKLKSYFKEIDGKKYINIKALDLYNEENSNDSEFNKLNEIINTLSETIKVLNQQLTVKDEQIAELTKTLQAEQALHNQTQQRLALPQENISVEPISTEPEQQEEKVAQSEKKSWFSKLFG